MVPVTLPLGEERIGTPKRTFDSIVIKALKTESVIEGVREELWGFFGCASRGGYLGPRSFDRSQIRMCMILPYPELGSLIGN